MTLNSEKFRNFLEIKIYNHNRNKNRFIKTKLNNKVDHGYRL